MLRARQGSPRGWVSAARSHKTSGRGVGSTEATRPSTPGGKVSASPSWPWARPAPAPSAPTQIPEQAYARAWLRSARLGAPPRTPREALPLGKADLGARGRGGQGGRSGAARAPEVPGPREPTQPDPCSGAWCSAGGSHVPVHTEQDLGGGMPRRRRATQRGASAPAALLRPEHRAGLRRPRRRQAGPSAAPGLNLQKPVSSRDSSRLWPNSRGETRAPVPPGL